jgi:hypothetical protein
MRRLALIAGGLGSVVIVGGVVGYATSGPSVPITATGTTVAGIPAAGLDAAQLRSLVGKAVAGESGPVTVVLGVRTVRLAMRQLGVSVDVPATAARALAVSGEHRRLGFGNARGRDVTPLLRVDKGRLRTVANRLVIAADVPESHGALTYASGVVTTTAPAAGQGASEAAVEKALRSAAERLRPPHRINVPVQPLPEHVNRAAVERLAATARSVMAATLQMRTGDRGVPVAGLELAPHLTIVGLGDQPGHAVALGLDPASRPRLAGPLAARLSSPAQEPRIAAPPAVSALTMQGSVLWRPRPAMVRLTSGGKPGRAVRVDDVLSALTDYLRTPGLAGVVTVASRPTIPDTSDVAARGVNALLGTFTTPFKCCAPRVKNISLMARTLDGTVIGPGQQFSLNGIIGRRTTAKGYVEAPFILDGELSKDVGGGVSQVATTTLNAAFFAGVRLDKHQAHSFYISRYPPGREATVNYPTIDLAWTNTTGGPIVVRATATSTSLTVSLYGQNDGRSVRAISGPRTPVNGADFRIHIVRIVSIPGKPPQQDGFTTSYNKPPKGE